MASCYFGASPDAPVAQEEPGTGAVPAPARAAPSEAATGLVQHRTREPVSGWVKTNVNTLIPTCQTISVLIKTSCVKAAAIRQGSGAALHSEGGSGRERSCNFIREPIEKNYSNYCLM